MSQNEIAAIADELEQLMAKLRVNVDALQAILTSAPEVPGDQPAATA